MTTSGTAIGRRADVFRCGHGLDLLERLAANPDGIGTDWVSLILGLRSNKGTGARLGGSKTEVEAHGSRCGHTVVRAARSAGADPTLESDLGGDHAFHVRRMLLYSCKLFAVREGIDETRAIVIDLDDSQPGRWAYSARGDRR